MHLVARLVTFGIGWIFKIDFNRYNNVLRILNYAVVQDNSPINFFLNIEMGMENTTPLYLVM